MNARGERIGRAKRLLEVTLGFEEDALDTAIASETYKEPASAAANVVALR